MTVDTYMCRECFEVQVFKPEERSQPHQCPKCGTEMDFWVTEEIDATTGKVVNSSDRDTNLTPPDVKQTIYDTMPTKPTKPTIECPYCHSTNTKKISTSSKVAHTVLWGIFSLSRNSKQWHCNNCNSNF